MLITLLNVSILLKNGHFPIFNLFVTIARVKVEKLGQSNKNILLKNNFYFLALKRSQNKTLNARSSLL